MVLNVPKEPEEKAKIQEYLCHHFPSGLRSLKSFIGSPFFLTYPPFCFLLWLGFENAETVYTFISSRLSIQIALLLLYAKVTFHFRTQCVEWGVAQGLHSLKTVLSPPWRLRLSQRAPFHFSVWFPEALGGNLSIESSGNIALVETLPFHDYWNL